jgi:hypothetical protein
MQLKPMAILFITVLLGCSNSQSQQPDAGPSKADKDMHENPYATIGEIPAPPGFERMKDTVTSFSIWLRNLPIKKNKTVFLYNGKQKPNQSAQFAVLDIPVGTQDLQQCADAVMKLRATYLFERDKYDSIVFVDNEQQAYRFTAPFSRDHLDSYLKQVFGMCGTASLSNQMKQVSNLTDIKPGDVFIRGGFPGHAAIVMDVAIDKKGTKRFLLAQSYMPAQDIHLLVNPLDDALSPWYALPVENKLVTPEYTFAMNELKRW